MSAIAARPRSRRSALKSRSAPCPGLAGGPPKGSVPGVGDGALNNGDSGLSIEASRKKATPNISHCDMIAHIA